MRGKDTRQTALEAASLHLAVTEATPSAVHDGFEHLELATLHGPRQNGVAEDVRTREAMPLCKRRPGGDRQTGTMQM